MSNAYRYVAFPIETVDQTLVFVVISTEKTRHQTNRFCGTTSHDTEYYLGIPGMPVFLRSDGWMGSAVPGSM